MKYNEEKNGGNLYIVIVASASKYGDYFTGGDGSTLWLDELSIEYDYNSSSFENVIIPESNVMMNELNETKISE